MKCVGEFKDDRICELCQITNKSEHEKCLDIKNKKIEMWKKLKEIERKCPYRHEEYSYSDRSEYYICNKKKMEKHDMWDDDCCVSLECEKYIK